MSSMSGLCSLSLWLWQSRLLSALVLASTLHPQLVLVSAYNNGMDMGMDTPMNLAAGNALTYLHFAPLGDVLWFQGWVPRSAGTMFGTCVGLFLLGLLERWLAGCRGLMEAHWRKQAFIIQVRRQIANTTRGKVETGIETSKAKVTAGAGAPPSASKKSTDELRSFAPQVSFIPSFDVARALMQTAQSAVEVAFMLAVMTYQASFIISIVVGQGVGETLFGRFNEAAHLH